MMHGAIDTAAADPSAWIAAEFTEPGALAEGVRSLARAALNAEPEHKAIAFEHSTREAARYATAAQIPVARVADLFAAVAERNGLAAELGPDGLQIVLAQAIARHDEAGDRQGAAGPDNDMAGPEPAPPPAGPGDYGNFEPRPSEPPPRPLFRPIPIDLITLGAEPQWLIDGIIPTRGLASVIGPPKSGKSFLTTDMLFHVALGKPYAGRAVLQGPVIYLTGEGVQGFKRRLIAMRRHYEVEGKGTDFFMVENVPDLGSDKTNLPAMMAELDEFLERIDCAAPAAIVLDTLARCMGDGDENVARDMGRFITRCGEIERHYGCVVVVVHHMGKDASKGGRGSNALNGAIDVSIAVEKGEGASTARIDEMKDGPEGQEWCFRLLPYQLDPEKSAAAETNDQDGAMMSDTTTCVVELMSLLTPTQHTEKKKDRVVPAGIAADLLGVIRAAISDVGQRNVPSDLVPRNVSVISREALKRHCKCMGWQDQDGKPDVFRAQLSRHLSGLRSRGLIGFTEEWLWVV